ncbi:MAG: hypothetical protein HUU15_12835, partial [Candidatus Brocadiae bacterium]|nr:hypothetical protein [Candidatus Brocadiia bacterium]
PPAPPAPRPRGGKRAPIRVTSLQLPPDIMWETASARRDLLHVAGFGRGGAVLARTPWSDAVQVLTWSPGINYPHILEPGPDAARAVLFAGSPGPRLELLSFPRSDGGLAASQAGTPPWFPDEVLGAAVGEFGTVWLVREHLGHLVAWAYSSAGAISGIHPLRILEAALPEGETARGSAPLPAVALGPALYVALALRLARIGRDGASTHLDLASPVTALVASPAAAGPILACAFDAGGAVIFEPDSLARVRRFGEDLADPLLTFTRNGFLVAVSEREGRIYSLEGGFVRECASFSIPGGRPVAVVPGAQAAEFAIVAGSGEVTVFTVPAP